MNWFQKLPGTRRAASGLEWTLWRKLPLIALAGTMLPLICLGLMHVASDGALQAADARWLQMAGYVVLGTITFDWFMVLTPAP